MNIHQLILSALVWAYAHPYAAFFLLLALLILYAKLIYPKEIR